jgi:iron complex transport system substrate-binding protein
LETDKKFLTQRSQSFAKLAKLFFILSLLLASCTPREKSVAEGEPQRIVSLSPAVTEILFAIGAGDRVVGVTQFCNYPPEAKTKTSVGGFSGATISVEQIRALQCDLVILSGEMHGRIISLLDELGVRSLAVEPRTFSEIYDTIAMIGEITGCAEGAGSVISGMKTKIADAGEKLRGRENARSTSGSVDVFFMLAENPLMTVGPGTYISEAMGFGGGRNIFDDTLEFWPQVSPEQVLVRKPDWILFGNDMGAVPSFGNQFWQSLSAVREGRIAVVDTAMLCRYGPRLADAVVSIAGILHGSSGDL